MDVCENSSGMKYYGQTKGDCSDFNLRLTLTILIHAQGNRKKFV